MFTKNKITMKEIRDILQTFADFMSKEHWILFNCNLTDEI